MGPPVIQRLLVFVKSITEVSTVPSESFQKIVRKRQGRVNVNMEMIDSCCKRLKHHTFASLTTNSPVACVRTFAARASCQHVNMSKVAAKTVQQVLRTTESTCQVWQKMSRAHFVGGPFLNVIFC